MSNWQRLLQHEAAGGVILCLAAVLAMIIDNSFLSPVYDGFKDLRIAIAVGDLVIDKPLLLWVNDGLMAVFFFHVGLEVKYELREGRLASPSQVTLPAAAAIGGMLVPALVFFWLNGSDPVLRNGWAIPAATDIAFALGVLALVGRGVPPALKVFLLALAIIDDIGAIVIIAVFYTDQVAGLPLQVAGIITALLLALNVFGARRIAWYILLGIILWVAVLKSGVHATLAGVLLALMIPLRLEDGRAPVHELELSLKPYVAFLVMPLFAFVNAGVDLSGFSLANLLEPLPLGIILGLFAGKLVGIVGASLLVVLSGLSRMPEGVSWGQITGAALLAGIGFTMSLFIGGLAYSESIIAAAAPEMSPESARLTALALRDQVRYGVLTASLVAGVTGFVILKLTTRANGTGRAQL